MAHPLVTSAFCVLSLSLVPPGASVAWERLYGGPFEDRARYVEPTSDGGFIITGSYATADSTWDIWVARTDATGDTVWTTAFGSPLNDQGYCIRETSDGKFVLGGSWAAATRQDDTAGGIVLALLDSDADPLWTWKLEGGDPAARGGINFVLEDDDSDFVAAGTRQAYGYNGNHRAFLVKIDRDTHQPVWEHLYPEMDRTSKTWGTCVRKTPSDGGFLLTGLYWPPESGADTSSVYLVKTDADGDSLWAHQFRPARDAEGRHMSLTADGGCIIAGNCDEPGEDLQAFLLKADEDGVEEWSKTYGGEEQAAAWSVVQTPDGGYAATGYRFCEVMTSRDLFLVRTDALGDTLWTRTFHPAPAAGMHSYTGYCIEALPNGFIVAGSAGWESNPGYYDLHLIRTDLDGRVDVESVHPPHVDESQPSLSIWPNPAWRGVRVRIGWPWSAAPSLAVLDVAGRALRTLAPKALPCAGEIEALWDGCDASGRPVASGVYYVSASAGARRATSPLIVVR